MLEWLQTPRGWRLVLRDHMDPGAAELAQAVNDRLLEYISTSQNLVLTQREVRYLAEAYRCPVSLAHGWCRQPLWIVPEYLPGYGRWAIRSVACRRCAGCHAQKQAQWAARGTAEMLVASRTWLVTLTLGPVARASWRLAVASGAQRWTVPYQRITELLDRLRHTHGLRYLLVQERHKDGMPHWHALFHERARPLRYAHLVSQWRLGFVHARLADADAAAYVAKYVTKAGAARVRASRRYGLPATGGPAVRPSGPDSPAAGLAPPRQAGPENAPVERVVENIEDTWD